jgi:hypothetical protein
VIFLMKRPLLAAWEGVGSTCRTLLALGGLFLVAGCATVQTYNPDEAPEMIVTVDTAPFYSRGPQQLGGPDTLIRRDDTLRLLRREFGFSYVQLEDGRMGFVPNGTFVPFAPRATDPRQPAPTTPPRQTSTPTSPEPEPLPDREPLPLFDDIILPDLQLTPQDIPPPILLDDDEDEEAPRPEFRL